MIHDRSYRARAHPSLALVKYWGKLPSGTNIPATTSVAVTLSGLETVTSTTTVDPDDPDRVFIDGVERHDDRFPLLFDRLRKWILERGGERRAYHVQSTNNFPTAAGLASSASGIAALVVSAARASLPRLDLTDPAVARELSALARIGSGSAARSIFGGFTRWRAGAESAEPIHPREWWPTLRIVVVPITADAKPISSRTAMNRTRSESPFYEAWVHDAKTIATEAEVAIDTRDLERLGRAMRLSYMRMFATMLGAAPPILFWLPGTIAVIHRLEELRTHGVPVWETIDAGPQVKVVTTEEHVAVLLDAVREYTAEPPFICTPGEAAR